MNEKENQSEEPLLTPNGEVAVERCPICDRPNNPGAMDACEHFVGCVWDGEIIWSFEFDEFQRKWDELRSLHEEAEMEETGDHWLSKINVYARKNGLDPKFCDMLREESSATDAISDLAGFSKGPTVATNGMLSGEGASCYHEDGGVIEKFARKLDRVLEGVRGKAI